eukprot:g1211.t1
MDTSMHGGSNGTYKLLAPPTVNISGGNFDDTNVNNLNNLSDILPSWLLNLDQVSARGGIALLHEKYNSRKYINRIKNLFCVSGRKKRKSRKGGNGGRDNNVDDKKITNYVIQILFVCDLNSNNDSKENKISILVLSKDGIMETSEQQENPNTLTLKTTFETYHQLLTKSLDLMVAFQTQQIELDGNMLISTKLKKLISIFAIPVKFPKYKLYKIECWRWVLLSGIKLTYKDRHGDIYVTDRIGRIGRQDSKDENVFILDDDEVCLQLSGSIGGLQKAGSLGINYITLTTNKNRTWTYGYKVDEKLFSSDPNFQEDSSSNRNTHQTLMAGIRGFHLNDINNRRRQQHQQHRNNNYSDSVTAETTTTSYIHCFRLRAADSIHAIGVGAINDPQLFKRLRRGKNVADKERASNAGGDGKKYFPIWSIYNHHKFFIEDRRSIETFYFIMLYSRSEILEKWQKEDNRVMPEAVIRYILQFY